MTTQTEIKQFNRISQYNEMLGIETLHPQISVIDFSDIQPIRHRRARYDFYAIFLKEVHCGDMYYGRQTYDYQEGTMVFLAPGQVAGFEDNGKTFKPKGWGLLFHPDILKGTSLGSHMKEYTFFSYESREALHLSEQERYTVIDLFKNIHKELLYGVDKHSKRLITSNIELLLNYCIRFYDRQFITRTQVNKDILTRFEHLLDNYFISDNPQREGLPSVSYCASHLCLSPNYFGDLIKKETGRTAQEYIQLHLIGTAKEKILSSPKSISEIAYELGFKYPQHFTRLFKKCTGYSPNEYRHSL